MKNFEKYKSFFLVCLWVWQRRKKRLYLITAFCDSGVNTGKCFALYDQTPVTENDGASEQVFSLMKKGEILSATKYFSNDLTESAKKLNPDIEKNERLLKTTSAKTVVMTGSGSCVYGVYESKKERNKEYRKLIKTGASKQMLKKVKTV